MNFPLPHEHVLPHEIQLFLPPNFSENSLTDRFAGSIVGLAVGDALGASVEFRPHQYFVDRPVVDMEGGGTWGLKTGQWTDDTSMALCLASSLITKHGYNPYDQMVRYKWWYKQGYMSSTGSCFDIGNATRDSLEEFSHRQNSLINRFHCSKNELDSLSWDKIQSAKAMDINCSTPGVAGNGALMRLAPVPLFFHQHPDKAVEYAGCSARLTHGDQKAVDACRYYAALIVAAVNGQPKNELLRDDFYESHPTWFGSTRLHPDILRVAHGSYKNPKGYDGGIRGKGYIVNALEAALWAFWSNGDTFEEGALAAVNLGDDTDTTAAIYGQLAGAFYGLKSIPKKWREKLYARELLVCIGQWLYFEGQQYSPTKEREMISSVQTPTKTLPNEQQLNTNLTSAHHVNLSPSTMHPTETKHTLKSRSDNNELSFSQQEYGRPRMYQQGDEQGSSRRYNTNQRSEHHQDTDQSRRHRQNLGQPSNYRPESYGSLGYQQRDSSSRTPQPDVKQLSTSRIYDNQVSAYGSDFNQPSKNTMDYKGSSAYGAVIHRSSLDNLNVSQVRIDQLTGTHYSTGPSIAQSSRTRSTDRPLITDTNRGYPYHANQIQSRSSTGDQFPVDNTNSMRRFETQANNESRRNQHFNDRHHATSSSNMYRQSLLPSGSSTIPNKSDQKYYDARTIRDQYRRNNQ